VTAAKIVVPEPVPAAHPRMVRVTCMSIGCPDYNRAKHLPLTYLGDGVYHDPGYGSGTFVCGVCDTGVPMDRGISYTL